MLHPRLTPVGATIGGASSVWLAQIGPYGSWGDLTFQTRWGDGASGMYEAQWTMPLPAQFQHPLLRRGTAIELMNGSLAVGSPLILSEPTVGTGLDQPWTFTATGIGRDVEGENSFYAFRLSDVSTTSVPSEAVDFAIPGGWRVTRGSSVPTGAIGGSSTTDELMSVGSLLNAAGEFTGQRWGVGQDGAVFFAADPTTPTYQVTPGAAALGTSDDGYATVVWLRYLDSATSTYKTVFAQDSATEARFGRKEYAVDLTDAGAVATATAQTWVNGVLARSKGRLAWTNNLTLSSNQLLTMGGVPADLSKVAEDVGAGCMVRLNGIFDDLLETTGATYLDIIIGEAKLVDSAETIDLSPIGLAPRDLASVVESVTGFKGGS